METCKVGFAQSAVDFSYEVKNCMKSQPQCLRNRDMCLGRCDGAGGGLLTQDFATTFVKQELSVQSIGSTAIDNGRANCTPKSRIVHVPLFDAGETFASYAARLRVRGGFNGKQHTFAATRAHARVLPTDPTDPTDPPSLIFACSQPSTRERARGSRWHAPPSSACLRRNHL